MKTIYEKIINPQPFFTSSAGEAIRQSFTIK